MGQGEPDTARRVRRAPLSRFRHFAAVDWSGAVGERLPGIAIALCSEGSAAPMLVRPQHRWSRAEVLAWLTADLPADTLVGLDLGTALPFVDRGAYFPDWPGSPLDARALWALVEQLCAGDEHLAVGSFVDHPVLAEHFRRPGRRTGQAFGSGRGRLRATEEAQRRAGLNPYSNLNLVGAAQVGKSSLTGMRVLHRLAGRLPIWPFDADPGGGSLLVEIYTTIAALAAGRTKNRAKMRDMAALNAALTHPAIASEPLPGTGEIDDHKSDALLTAGWLRRVVDCAPLWHPADMTDAIRRTEGWTFGIA